MYRGSYGYSRDKACSVLELAQEAKVCHDGSLEELLRFLEDTLETKGYKSSSRRHLLLDIEIVKRLIKQKSNRTLSKEIVQLL